MSENRYAWKNRCITSILNFLVPYAPMSMLHFTMMFFLWFVSCIMRMNVLTTVIALNQPTTSVPWLWNNDASTANKDYLYTGTQPIVCLQVWAKTCEGRDMKCFVSLGGAVWTFTSVSFLRQKDEWIHYLKWQHLTRHFLQQLKRYDWTTTRL